MSIDTPAIEPTREEMRKNVTIKRRQTKEGIDVSDIITEKRPRIKTDRLNYSAAKSENYFVW